VPQGRQRGSIAQRGQRAAAARPAHAARTPRGYELVLIDGPPAVQRVIAICGLREQLAFAGAQGSTSPRRIA
jgi:hypothetical protein